MITPVNFKEFIKEKEFKSIPSLKKYIDELEPKLSEVYDDIGHLHISELVVYYEEVLSALSHNNTSMLHEISLNDFTISIPFSSEPTVNDKATLLLAMTALALKNYDEYMKSTTYMCRNNETPTTSPIVEMKKYL